MSKRKQVDEIIDVRFFVFKLINNWFYFLISILFAIAIAFGVNRYSKEIFLAETTLLIQEKTSMASTAAEMLYDSGLQQSKMGLKNEEIILKSSPLIYETVKNLGFDVSYFLIGKIKTSETFEDLPFKVVNKNQSSILHGEKFTVSVIDKNSFKIYDGKNVKEGTYLFGEDISIKKHTIKIISQVENIKEGLPNYVVRFLGLKSVVSQYQNKLIISQPERESTILTLSVFDANQYKGIAFLNKLTENYIKKEIDEKNTVSRNTIDFINNKLTDMKDSLSLIELSIQEYKNKHEITDISLKAQSFYDKLAELGNEQTKYKLKEQYYKYLIRTINEKQNLEKIISPSIYGITDASLNELINQLVSFQIQKEVIKEEGQVKNPAVSRFTSNINQLILKIKESVDNNLEANKYLIEDVNKRISEIDLLFLLKNQETT